MDLQLFETTLLRLHGLHCMAAKTTKTLRCRGLQTLSGYIPITVYIHNLAMKLDNPVPRCPSIPTPASLRWRTLCIRSAGLSGMVLYWKRGDHGCAVYQTILRKSTVPSLNYADVGVKKKKNIVQINFYIMFQCGDSTFPGRCESSIYSRAAEYSS